MSGKRVKLIKLFSKKNNCKPKQFESIIFRNDDVSFDSNVEHFREFCSVFHKYGYTQLHAINLYGRTNCKYSRS